MSLRFWLGPAGSGKSTKLYNYMIEESVKHPDMNYFIIVPEQANLSTQQKLVTLHPRKGILNMDVLSFNRLAHRVFEETGYGLDGGRVVDDMGKNLVLRRVSQIHKDELVMLGDNLRKLGYITEVKSVISEFMQYGISWETACQMCQEASEANKGQLAAKLKDVSLLYGEFLSYIKDHYTTREELMIRLAKILPSSEKIKKTVIAFDGFTGFAPVQNEVVEQLLMLCPEVHVVLNLDKRSDDGISLEEHELFYMSKHTISKLGKLADACQVMQLDPVVILDEIPYRYNNNSGSNKMLAHLERNIFRNQMEVYAEPLTESISVLKALNPEEEMEAVARAISELIREKDYRYKDIAIITGDIELYRSSIERALTRHNLPYFTDQTQPILLNPMIEYLRAAISVLADNYTYESVFRLLKTGLADIEREEIDRFENYCIAAGVKGRSSYRKTFAYLPKEYRHEKAEGKAEYLIGINETRVKVNDIFEKLESEIADKYNAGTKATVECYAKALYKMMATHKIGQKLKKRAEEFAADGHSDESKAYGQIYERVLKVFEQMVELLGEEKLTIKEFGQLLDAGLDEIRIGLIPGSTDYIQVGDIIRSRVGDVKALFVVGVNDGLIPPGVSTGGLLSDDDKTFFTELHEDVAFAPTARESAYTQRLYLYMMLAKPSCELHLSYSKINPSGESIRPSYLIRTVEGLFPKMREKCIDEKLLSGVSDKKGSFRLIAENLRKYTDYELDEEDRDVFEYLTSVYGGASEYSERLAKIIDNYRPEISGNISKAVAAALYGHNLYSSVTRLETYASCAYEYYLKYGLKLNGREVFDFESNDLGTVFHSALEVYSNVLRERNISWDSISDEEAASIMDEAVERAVASEEMAALYSTRRKSYMVRRVKRIMRRTASVLKYQASNGKFIPHSVEVDFNSISNLDALNLKLSDEDSIRLFGRIDRIDTCSEDDTTYVRVIDYKSGETSLDIEAVYEGRQLQLVVYMDTALEMIRRSTGGKVVPAGILYYHVDDPVLKSNEVDDISKIEDIIRGKLRMTGYVNSDSHIINLMDSGFSKKSDIIPVSLKKDGDFAKESKILSSQGFEDLSDRTREAIVNMGRRILAGDIETAKDKGDLIKYPNTCDYCDYKSICRQKSRDNGLITGAIDDSEGDVVVGGNE